MDKCILSFLAYCEQTCVVKNIQKISPRVFQNILGVKLQTELQTQKYTANQIVLLAWTHVRYVIRSVGEDKTMAKWKAQMEMVS